MICDHNSPLEHEIKLQCKMLFKMQSDKSEHTFRFSKKLFHLKTYRMQWRVESALLSVVIYNYMVQYIFACNFKFVCLEYLSSRYSFRIKVARII